MGTYYLMEEKRIINACDEVAIAFSKEEDGNCILHKHGSPNMVQSWIDMTRQVYKENGFDDIAMSLYMIIGKFPVEDINRILDTTGWIKVFLQKHDIKLEDKKVSQCNQKPQSAEIG
jgi:hypothetical protein